MNRICRGETEVVSESTANEESEEDATLQMLLDLKEDIEFGFKDRNIKKQDYQKLIGNETVKEYINVISLYNHFVAKNSRILNKDIYYLGSLISNFKSKHKKNLK